MKYFYTKPTEWTMFSGFTYACDHPMYDACTLYLKDDIGVAVVQKRWNKKKKISWWGPIDPWLIDDISSRKEWHDWFIKHAQAPINGLYPTYSIRKVMWAMRMKPLRREYFEQTL